MRKVYQKISTPKGNIASVIHYPENASNKLAILCPGYLDTKDYAHIVGLANELCAEDFAVVRFDPIGTWESDGDISDYTMTQYLENIKYVLEYMLSQAPYKIILLGGHSRGGQVSILYAAHDSRISIVLGIMPSYGHIEGQKLKEWGKNGVCVSRRTIPIDESKRREFRVPFNYILDADKYDAIGAVRKIKVPIILIAGELDSTVPAEEVKEFFDNANEPKKFRVLANIVHDYRLDADKIKLVDKEIMEQLTQFL